MEQDQTQAAVAEAPNGQAPTSEESASTAQDTNVSPQEDALMNALLRGNAGQGQDSASKPDGETPDDEGAEVEGGESAPSGDVKPPDQSKPGRRSAAAEIAHLKAENERLQKAYQEANPPPPDASEEARKASVEREQRFRSLLLKPDTDQDWDADDWKWLQEEKAKRSAAPELRQHYETVLEQDRASLEQDAIRREHAFLKGQADQILTLSALPGIDAEAFKAAPYAVQGRMLYDAREPEIRRLTEEIADLKREALGFVRTAPNGGRSSPGRTYSEDDFMNTVIRGGRA